MNLRVRGIRGEGLEDRGRGAAIEVRTFWEGGQYFEGVSCKFFIFLFGVVMGTSSVMGKKLAKCL